MLVITVPFKTKVVPFSANGVSPVCLPSLDMNFKIHGLKGYVAGWGMTRNPDCFTNNYGPERHSKCRFPFKYKGNYKLQSRAEVFRQDCKHQHRELIVP